MNIPYVFRKCTRCNEWLVANKINFTKKKSGKWGLNSHCRKCEKKRNGQWRENNKEHKEEYDKQWRENNREYSKQYYEEHKEYAKECNKRWREEHKEEIKEKDKQYYEEHREERIEYSKQWRKNNPHVSFNSENKRRSKLENQGRGITKEQWQEMMAFFNWRCAYSEIQLIKGNRSVDHIVALSNNGLNEPWNCVPMYINYNSSKHKKVDVLDWYMEQEYFDIDRLDKIVEWQIYAYEKWGGEEFGELILITDLFEEE